jgi:hypothetical protein
MRGGAARHSGGAASCGCWRLGTASPRAACPPKTRTSLMPTSRDMSLRRLLAGASRSSRPLQVRTTGAGLPDPPAVTGPCGRPCRASPPRPRPQATAHALLTHADALWSIPAAGGSGIMVKNVTTVPDKAKPFLKSQTWDWVMIMVAALGRAPGPWSFRVWGGCPGPAHGASGWARPHAPLGSIQAAAAVAAAASPCLTGCCRLDFPLAGRHQRHHAGQEDRQGDLEQGAEGAL